jgi:hypothetical protein
MPPPLSSPRKALTPRRQPWNPPIVGPACIPPSVRLQSSDGAMLRAQSQVNNMVVSQQTLDNDLRTIDADYASILHTAPGAKQTVWLSKYYIRPPPTGAARGGARQSLAAATPRSTTTSGDAGHNDVAATDADLSSTANTVAVGAAVIPASPTSPQHGGGQGSPRGHPPRRLSPSALGGSSSSRPAREPPTQDPPLSLPNPNTGDLRGASFVGGLTPRAQRRLIESSGSTPRSTGKSGASANECFVPSTYPDKMNWLNFDRNAENARVSKRQDALARVASDGSSSAACRSDGIAVEALVTKEELMATHSSALESAVVDLTYRCEAHYLECGGHEDTWTFALNEEDDLLNALGRLIRTYHGEAHQSPSMVADAKNLIDVKRLGTFLETEGVGAWESLSNEVRRRSSAHLDGSDALLFSIRHKSTDGGVTSAHRVTFRRLRIALQAYAATTPMCDANESVGPPTSAPSAIVTKMPSVVEQSDASTTNNDEGEQPLAVDGGSAL